MFGSEDSLVGRRKIIARNIRARRKVLDLTQGDLAEAIGVDKGRIGRIERGIASLDFEEIPPLCDLLGIEDHNILYQPDYFHKI